MQIATSKEISVKFTVWRMLDTFLALII